VGIIESSRTFFGIVKAFRTFLLALLRRSGRFCGHYQGIQDVFVGIVKAFRTFLWALSRHSGRFCGHC
jgi:hypothetical protein